MVSSLAMPASKPEFVLFSNSLCSLVNLEPWYKLALTKYSGLIYTVKLKV